MLHKIGYLVPVGNKTGANFKVFAISSALIFKEWVHQKIAHVLLMNCSGLSWILGRVRVGSIAAGRFQPDCGFESDCTQI